MSYYTDDRVTLYHGDCIEVMRTLPDASVDAVVTDPPYELSNDGKNSAARVAVEVMFPQDTNFPPSLFEEVAFDFLASKIAQLSLVNVLPTEPTSVEVSAVALDDDPAGGQNDVGYANKLSIRTTKRDRCADVKAQPDHHLGCFALKLTDRETVVDTLHGAGAGFVSGGLRIGLSLGATRDPRFLHGSGPVVIGNQYVRLVNDSFAQLVSALPRAKKLPVSSPIDFRWGLTNEVSTGSAITLLALGQSSGAQLVRALAPAGGLPSVLEPVRFRVVSDTTDRALTFDLLTHKPRIASFGFMGKEWDGSKVAYNLDVWREALRVLKPGGHLLAFGGTRTWHRLAVAIEDAGFEVRDSIAWMYGSGFPKSHDVSKGIDKAVGARRNKVRIDANEVRNPKAIGNGTNGMEGGTRPWIEAALQRGYHEKDSNIPATPAAQQWQGWGTALKPAHEPIVVARKPLIGTVAANVLTHGTGALNIDGCRIAASAEDFAKLSAGVEAIRNRGGSMDNSWKNSSDLSGASPANPAGRWPANVILDESQAAELDKQSGVTTSAKPEKVARRGGSNANPMSWQESNGELLGRWPADTGGGASRFFYVAKAGKKERPNVNGVAHPTVKPMALMQYLVRLVTPPGGTVLEPFAGSGTTIEAALNEGFNVIGIEMTDEYLPLIMARIERYGDKLC